MALLPVTLEKVKLLAAKLKAGKYKSMAKYILAYVNVEGPDTIVRTSRRW